VYVTTTDIRQTTGGWLDRDWPAACSSQPGSGHSAWVLPFPGRPACEHDLQHISDVHCLCEHGLPVGMAFAYYDCLRFWTFFGPVNSLFVLVSPLFVFVSHTWQVVVTWRLWVSANGQAAVKRGTSQAADRSCLASQSMLTSHWLLPSCEWHCIA